MLSFTGLQGPPPGGRPNEEGLKGRARQSSGPQDSGSWKVIHGLGLDPRIHPKDLYSVLLLVPRPYQGENFLHLEENEVSAFLVALIPAPLERTEELRVLLLFYLL